MKRKEDPRLVAGLGQFIEDIRLPRMAYATFLRSTYAHARIRKIDISNVSRRPGVLLAIKGEDSDRALPSAAEARMLKGIKVPQHFPLTRDKVRHVGEPVAAVVSNDPDIARDALDYIETDYDPLPAVVDSEKALAKTSPLVHEEFGDNIALHWQYKKGNLEDALTKAPVVVKQRFVNQRLAPAALEPRGVIAHYEAIDGSMTFWTSTQFPHTVRKYLSALVGIPEHKFRVIAPDVGGGFGAKGSLYGEEALLALMSIKLNRPVKWVQDRTEDFVATIHARDQIHYVEIGATKTGQILGLRDKIIADLGAYQQRVLPSLIPVFTANMLPGAYKISNVDIELLCVFTNSMSTDAYRGAGRPEATFIIERCIDLLARELGIDPAEMRMRNFVKPDEFPFVTATGLEYDSGNYGANLVKALEIVNYEKLRKEQKRLREEGRYLGIGLATYVELCGFGPSKTGITGYESATVRVSPSGKITVLTGISPHGQGSETSFSQIVSLELGVPAADVVVAHGDTATIPQGVGTYGSRGVSVGGIAVLQAARKIKQKAFKIAAHLLEASADDLIILADKIHVKGSPEASITLAKIAEAANSAKDLPAGLEPGLEETSFFDPPNYVYPFGTAIAVVEVDTLTGEVALQRFVSVDDCGPVISPVLAEGQIHGAVAQGLGQALFEKVVYDEYGQLLTSTLTDYNLPTTLEIPNIESDHTETPSPVNPLGVKGIAEAGTVSAPAAVANAVEDALRPFNATITELPLRPNIVWTLLRNSSTKQ